MFSFQISGLKQDIEDLEEEYFAEHANFFPLTGTLCIPKQMRQLYCGGRLGGGRAVEIGSRRGIGCGGGKGGRFPCSPTMLTINSCSV